MSDHYDDSAVFKYSSTWFIIISSHDLATRLDITKSPSRMPCQKPMHPKDPERPRETPRDPERPRVIAIA